MKRIVMSGVAWLILTGAGLGADNKIAVVDMVRLIGAHPQTEISRSLIKDELQEFESEQEKMIAKMGDMKKDLQRLSEDSRNDALSDIAREKAREEARAKIMALQRYEQQARAKIMTRQKEIGDQRLRMGRRVVAKIREIIGEQAKKKDYAVVLDFSGISANGAESVIYHQESIDITEDILKIMSEQKKP